MMKVLKSALKKLRLGGQHGFTLAEVMIAVMISALIIYSLAQVFIDLNVVGVKSGDQAVATSQVQYAGFWVSEDGVQAQVVSLGRDIVGGAIAEDASVGQAAEPAAAQNS